MTNVFIASDNIVSPVGVTSAENFSRLKAGRGGITLHHNEELSDQPFYASLFGKNAFCESDKSGSYTKFEQLLIMSVQDALTQSRVNAGDKATVLIVSSTKGNISLMERKPFSEALESRMALHTSARLVAEHFGFINKPVVVSSACISGLLGLITAMRLIQSGQYENAVVTGADVISKFILSGFQSFQALSSQPCRPFDALRDGITLGEGAGTIILSSDPQYAGGIRMAGGSVSNDANHISGPSRTGEELFQAIGRAMQSAHLAPGDIDIISAHGTATVYNDEMEAKAIALARMQAVPVNSLKGYFGHTLGAAGLIESVISIHSLKENMIFPTAGFKEHGVSQPLNICNQLEYRELNNCIKMASGFGGCNSAIVFSKKPN